MKIKVLFAVFLMIVLAGVLSAQAKEIKAVETRKAPLTSPITYTVSGHVQYRQTNPYGKAYHAVNVQIIVRNVQTQQTFITFTNNQGNFSIAVPSARYRISPHDNYGTTFSPLSLEIDVDHNVYQRFWGYRDLVSAGTPESSVKLGR